MNQLVVIDEEKVLEIAADGATLADICRSVDIKPIQLYAYCKRYPIFSQRLKEARETGFLTRAEALPDIIVNGIDLGTFQDSKHLRVYVDTEKWLLSKLHASTFGDKQTITHEYVDINKALQDAKRRTIDVTPKPQELTDCANPFD